jgi:long-chain acyl-CoA synthetase
MKPHNLIELLACSVKRTPDHPAFIWFDNGNLKQMTYHKLWSTIQDFALGLEKIGIRPGDKVAIYGQNDPRWIISDLAVLSIGAISIPIHPSLPTRQVSLILKDAETTAIILGNEQLFSHIPQLAQITKHQILMYKEENRCPALSFETVIQMGQTIELEEKKWPSNRIQTSEPASLLYPSAANSKMYGALLSHGHFLNNLKAVNYMIPILPEDICYSELSFSDPCSRMVGYLMILFHGATISFAPRNQSITTILQEIQPTLWLIHSDSFETVMNQFKSELDHNHWFKKKTAQWAKNILRKQNRSEQQVYNGVASSSQELKYTLAKWFITKQLQKKLGGKLRMIIAANVPLSSEIAQLLHDIQYPIIEAFSIPECAGVVTANPLHRIKPNTIGIPLPNVQARLANDQLIIKSPSTMLGYYNQPEETAKKIVNGWYYTDLPAIIDPEGYISLISCPSTEMEREEK